MLTRRAVRCLLVLVLVPSPAATAATPASPDSAIHLRVDVRDVASQEHASEWAADDRAPREPGPLGTSDRHAGPAAARHVGANVRMNSLLGSPANNGESEVSIAAIGSRLVSAWNDGRTFAVQPGFVGFGYSTTAGATWSDGGSLPAVSTQDVYYGDPVVAADPAGHWYVADLYRPFPGITGISVNHGVFTEAAPAWDLPETLATSPVDLLDKPWITVDPEDGSVYCAWVRFSAFGGQWIEFSRSLDHGAHWSALQKLTSPDSTAPMSPRLTVGPLHEVDLAYYTSSFVQGGQHLRHRRSVDHGQHWGPDHEIGGRPFYNNFYSGPAGFNRERVVALVSLAVDRSVGPSSGRLHAVWCEMVNALADPLGLVGTVNELEPNDTGDQAIPFTPGASLRGSLGSPTDQDWWSFTGLKGQTFIAQLSPLGPTDAFLRLFAGGGAVANRCA